MIGLGLTEDAITLINLPAGPTAYFKLTSVQLGKEIHVSLSLSLLTPVADGLGSRESYGTFT